VLAVLHFDEEGRKIELALSLYGMVSGAKLSLHCLVRTAEYNFHFALGAGESASVLSRTEAENWRLNGTGELG